jgi:hypothetical protein
MELWWHDFYATIVQVIALLLVAMVVESNIRSSLPRWILVVGLWLCMPGGGLAIWILSEEDPNPRLVRIGQWVVGLPTTILVLIIAIAISVQIIRGPNENPPQ